MTSQPVAYSSSSSSNIFKHTPGFELAGGRVRPRVANSKRRLSDLQEKSDVTKPVNIQPSGAGEAAPSSASATPAKRGRRSLFEECQERLSGGNAEQAVPSRALDLSERFMGEACQGATDIADVLKHAAADKPVAGNAPGEDQDMSDSNQEASTDVDLAQDMVCGDPSEVCSPVKRSPGRPANDGFHRTFLPFDMLRSPTSLSGQSFKDLNAHLAQNARLSTRQRNLRHDLRTATKEYMSGAAGGNGIVANVMPWVAPAAAPGPPAAAPLPPPQDSTHPIMIAVTRGGVVSSNTLLNRGNGSGLISINRMAGPSTHTVPIRRCIF